MLQLSPLAFAVSRVQDKIVITVTSQVTPAINIAASSTNICAGTAVSFVATASFGGNSPLYQWQINGVNAGTNTNTFNSSLLTNGDLVSCRLTSNAACATSTTANSNIVAMTVNSMVTPAISITASSTKICSGTNVNFVATQLNAGSSPVYQWILNGVNVGNNTAVYNTTALKDNDAIVCRLSSNANCLVTPVALSDTIRLKVYPIPVVNAGPDVTILEGGSVVFDPVATGKLDYKWFPALYLNNDTARRPVCVPENNMNYTVTVTNEGGCSSSDQLSVIVNKLSIPSAFSPNGDGINDVWRIPSLYSYPGAVVEVFNRQGNVVFRTERNTSWDGTLNGKNLPAGTYYYIVDTKLKGQQRISGWVHIIR